MRCKNCKEKEAKQYSEYTSGNFCSRECARSFSTKKKREEINEKVSQKLKNKSDKTYTCTSCGENLEKDNKYCSECRDLSRWSLFYKRLDLLNNDDVNYKKVNQKACNLIHKKYHKNDFSFTDLKKKYGIHLRSIENFFNKNDLNQRSISRSISHAIEKGKQKLSENTNECYNDGYHTTWFDEEVYLRSSYEFLLANVLDDLKIKYEVESIKIPYYTDQKKSVYIPDFYIPKLNLIIETKSEYLIRKGNIGQKQKAVLEAGYSFLLLSNEDEIKNLNLMKHKSV